ncbi:MAG: post-transcriptional regulator [Aerococcus suis]|nr:post-transcriptional regulator [Aerococcus suis]
MGLSKFRMKRLQSAFQSKAQEFAEEGYGHVGEKDIQAYFFDYAWKEDKPRSVGKQIKAVRTLTANQYFDYEKLRATVYDVSPLEEMDIENLL